MKRDSGTTGSYGGRGVIRRVRVLGRKRTSLKSWTESDRWTKEENVVCVLRKFENFTLAEL